MVDGIANSVPMDTTTTQHAPIVTVTVVAAHRRFVIRRVGSVCVVRTLVGHNVIDVGQGSTAFHIALNVVVILMVCTQMTATPRVNASVRGTLVEEHVISVHQGTTSIRSVSLVTVTRTVLMASPVTRQQGSVTVSQHLREQLVTNVVLTTTTIHTVKNVPAIPPERRKCLDILLEGAEHIKMAVCVSARREWREGYVISARLASGTSTLSTTMAVKIVTVIHEVLLANRKFVKV